MPEIRVDEEVVKLVLREKTDFRVCTACRGPALVPVSIKSPKASDIKIPVGDFFIYVSAVQARYIDAVTIDMVYSKEEIDSCPAFYTYEYSPYSRRY